MIDHQLLVFMGTAFFLTITPGADTMLVMRSVLAFTWKEGMATNLGICSGLLAHALFSALGLSLILVRSATAFEVVKLVGGGYLIFLGIQAIWQAFKSSSKSIILETFEGNSKRQKTARKFFITGFLTNLLNPKVALFYLAFLPQFISSADAPFVKSILLGSIHLFFSFVWLVVVAIFVVRLKRFLVTSQVKRALEAITGVLLIGLGTKLALEHE
ncbi:MAG: LysE family translocator [Cyanobacteria bacterium P01_F01_bin.150]